MLPNLVFYTYRSPDETVAGQALPRIREKGETKTSA